MASQSTNCPILQIGQTPIRCENCPFVDMKNKRCVWRKIKETYQKEREKAKQEGFLDPNKLRMARTVFIIGDVPIIKVYSIQFIQQTIIQAKCPNCDKLFEINELKAYPHPSEGIMIEGYTLKQMVYCKCKNCGRETFLTEIFRQLGRSL